MSRDDTAHGTPTRRDYVKYGGAVVGAGLLAGCTGGEGDDAAQTESENGAGDTSEETGESTAYDVCMEPVGCVEFEEPPTSWLGSFGFIGDLGLSLGIQDDVAGMVFPSTWYTGWYDELPGVSVDTDAIRGIVDDDGAADKEAIYEIDPDIIAVDPNLLTNNYGFDADDIAEIEANVAPFFGNRSRNKRSEGWSAEPYAYYGIDEYVETYGRVFGREERATAINELFTETIADIRDRVPPTENRPSIGLIHPTWPDPQNGEFAIYNPISEVEKVWGKKQYRDLGVVDAFEGLYDGESSIMADYELLLDIDPDAFVFHFGVLNTEDGAVEATREAMRGDPLGSELTAVEDDLLHLGGTAYQGPVTNLFQTEMLAKQLYPEEFGEWHGPGETPEEEQLFDRQHVADIINGDI